jgi:hypothetical protein
MLREECAIFYENTSRGGEKVAESSDLANDHHGRVIIS